MVPFRTRLSPQDVGRYIVLSYLKCQTTPFDIPFNIPIYQFLDMQEVRTNLPIEDRKDRAMSPS